MTTNQKIKNFSYYVKNFSNQKILNFAKPKLTYINRGFTKHRLKLLIYWCFNVFGEKKTVDLVELLKTLGYDYATKAGISLSLEDLQIPYTKPNLLYSTEQTLRQAKEDVEKGYLTSIEYVTQVLDRWNATSEQLKDDVIQTFKKKDILNPVYMMAFSGARGSINQVKQLAGMRGLMADPGGQIIDFPIQSNFREGLSLTEYMISCYGARKGVVDTALRTATSGYLTRRLVDVAHQASIRSYNCGTQDGIVLSALKSGNKTLYSLKDRLIGRVLAKNVYDQSTGAKIGHSNEQISHNLANRLSKLKTPILVRSSMTCKDGRFICQLCYGWSLALSRLVSIGESVGVIAAQSIGEPGTQLTMRTFHTGGVFSGDIAEEIHAPFNGIVEFPKPLLGLCVRTTQGQIAFLIKQKGCLILKNNQQKTYSLTLDPYSLIFVKQNQNIKSNQVLAEKPILHKLEKSINVFQTVYSTLNGEIRFTKTQQIQGFSEYVLLKLEDFYNNFYKNTSNYNKFQELKKRLKNQSPSSLTALFKEFLFWNQQKLKPLFQSLASPVSTAPFFQDDLSFQISTQAQTNITNTTFWILASQRQTVLKPLNHIMIQQGDLIANASSPYSFNFVHFNPTFASSSIQMNYLNKIQKFDDLIYKTSTSLKTKNVCLHRLPLFALETTDYQTKKVLNHYYYLKQNQTQTGGHVLKMNCFFNMQTNAKSWIQKNFFIKTRALSLIQNLESSISSIHVENKFQSFYLNSLFLKNSFFDLNLAKQKFTYLIFDSNLLFFNFFAKNDLKCYKHFNINFKPIKNKLIINPLLFNCQKLIEKSLQPKTFDSSSIQNLVKQNFYFNNRFNNIYTYYNIKFRKINLTLNNSQQIKSKIKFNYKLNAYIISMNRKLNKWKNQPKHVKRRLILFWKQQINLKNPKTYFQNARVSSFRNFKLLISQKNAKIWNLKICLFKKINTGLITLTPFSSFFEKPCFNKQKIYNIKNKFKLNFIVFVKQFYRFLNAWNGTNANFILIDCYYNLFLIRHFFYYNKNYKLKIFFPTILYLKKLLFFNHFFKCFNNLIQTHFKLVQNYRQNKRFHFPCSILNNQNLNKIQMFKSQLQTFQNPFESKIPAESKIRFDIIGFRFPIFTSNLSVNCLFGFQIKKNLNFKQRHYKQLIDVMKYNTLTLKKFFSFEIKKSSLLTFKGLNFKNNAESKVLKTDNLFLDKPDTTEIKKAVTNFEIVNASSHLVLKNNKVKLNQTFNHLLISQTLIFELLYAVIIKHQIKKLQPIYVYFSNFKLLTLWLNSLKLWSNLIKRNNLLNQTLVSKNVVKINEIYGLKTLKNLGLNVNLKQWQINYIDFFEFKKTCGQSQSLQSLNQTCGQNLLFNLTINTNNHFNLKNDYQKNFFYNQKRFSKLKFIILHKLNFSFNNLLNFFNPFYNQTNFYIKYSTKNKVIQNQMNKLKKFKSFSFAYGYDNVYQNKILKKFNINKTFNTKLIDFFLKNAKQKTKPLMSIKTFDLPENKINFEKSYEVFVHYALKLKKLRKNYNFNADEKQSKLWQNTLTVCANHYLTLNSLNQTLTLFYGHLSLACARLQLNRLLNFTLQLHINKIIFKNKKLMQNQNNQNKHQRKTFNIQKNHFPTNVYYGWVYALNKPHIQNKFILEGEAKLNKHWFESYKTISKHFSNHYLANRCFVNASNLCFSFDSKALIYKSSYDDFWNNGLFQNRLISKIFQTCYNINKMEKQEQNKKQTKKAKNLIKFWALKPLDFYNFVKIMKNIPTFISYNNFNLNCYLEKQLSLSLNFKKQTTYYESLFFYALTLNFYGNIVFLNKNSLKSLNYNNKKFRKSNIKTFETQNLKLSLIKNSDLFKNDLLKNLTLSKDFCYCCSINNNATYQMKHLQDKSLLEHHLRFKKQNVNVFLNRFKNNNINDYYRITFLKRAKLPLIKNVYALLNFYLKTNFQTYKEILLQNNQTKNIKFNFRNFLNPVKNRNILLNHSKIYFNKFSRYKPELMLIGLNYSFNNNFTKTNNVLKLMFQQTHMLALIQKAEVTYDKFNQKDLSKFNQKQILNNIQTYQKTTFKFNKLNKKSKNLTNVKLMSHKFAHNFNISIKNFFENYFDVYFPWLNFNSLKHNVERCFRYEQISKSNYICYNTIWQNSCIDSSFDQKFSKPFENNQTFDPNYKTNFELLLQSKSTKGTKGTKGTTGTKGLQKIFQRSGFKSKKSLKINPFISELVKSKKGFLKKASSSIQLDYKTKSNFKHQLNLKTLKFKNFYNYLTILSFQSIYPIKTDCFWLCFRYYMLFRINYYKTNLKSISKFHNAYNKAMVSNLLKQSLTNIALKSFGNFFTKPIFNYFTFKPIDLITCRKYKRKINLYGKYKTNQNFDFLQLYFNLKTFDQKIYRKNLISFNPMKTKNLRSKFIKNIKLNFKPLLHLRFKRKNIKLKSQTKSFVASSLIQKEKSNSNQKIEQNLKVLQKTKQKKTIRKTSDLIFRNFLVKKDFKKLKFKFKHYNTQKNNLTVGTKPYYEKSYVFPKMIDVVTLKQKHCLVNKTFLIRPNYVIVNFSVNVNNNLKNLINQNLFDLPSSVNKKNLKCSANIDKFISKQFCSKQGEFLIAQPSQSFQHLALENQQQNKIRNNCFPLLQIVNFFESFESSRFIDQTKNDLALKNWINPYGYVLKQPLLDYNIKPKIELRYLTNEDLITYDICLVQLKKLTNNQTSEKFDNLLVSIGDLVPFGTPFLTQTRFSESGQVLLINKNKIILRKAKLFSLASGSNFILNNGYFVNRNAPLLQYNYKQVVNEDIIQGIPKIERLFEARSVKTGLTLSQLLKQHFQKLSALFLIQQDPLFVVSAANKALKFIQHYTLDAIQNVYQSQGVSISDKHIELILKQMTSKVIINDPKNSGFLKGDLVDFQWAIKANQKIKKETDKLIYEPYILGISQASLRSKGFISAASFQETVKVLTQAAYFRKTDFLFGLKENVILGHLISVGTGEKF